MILCTFFKVMYFLEQIFWKVHFYENFRKNFNESYKPIQNRNIVLLIILYFTQSSLSKIMIAIDEFLKNPKFLENVAGKLSQ